MAELPLVCLPAQLIVRKCAAALSRKLCYDIDEILWLLFTSDAAHDRLSYTSDAADDRSNKK